MQKNSRKFILIWFHRIKITRRFSYNYLTFVLGIDILLPLTYVIYGLYFQISFLNRISCDIKKITKSSYTKRRLVNLVIIYGYIITSPKINTARDMLNWIIQYFAIIYIIKAILKGRWEEAVNNVFHFSNLTAFVT